MKGRNTLPFLVSFGASLLMLTGCMRGESDTTGSSITKRDVNGNLDPARLLSRTQILEQYSNVSCESLRHLIDYLDQIGSTDYFRGLSGDIYYQTQTCRSQQGVWNNLENYYQGDAVKIDSKLYLSKLDVPTRRFSLGFPKLDGTKIQNTEGSNLLEYFSIDFRTDLKLGPDDEEGDYEFAMLSDDGVEMTAGVAGEIVLSSPAIHPTKMVCSTRVVNLKRGDLMPTRIRYFQGPREHIALTMLWRKAGQGQDPLCGTMGNDAFFDFNQDPSVPKKNYNDLLARGWQVVPAHVFRIPRDEYMNPCESDYVRDIIADENNGNNGGNCDATNCGDIGL